jgi:CheY-like chemotaxis protein
VTIADTGVGLTSEQIGSIFEPFYSTGGSEQGTGIGLTVVSNIMTRMHGALDVQSSVGKGTRIFVYWPLASADTLAAEMPDVAGASGQGETVMVVDDEPELVSLTEEVLATLGYEPVGFTGSRAALKAFRAQPRRFDALVTDQRMKELDGCALAKRIHKIDTRLPIIMVTGYRDADMMRRAKDAGIAEILDKPLNTQTLAAALSRQLASSSKPERAAQ